jgi:hypothetical protein
MKENTALSRRLRNFGSVIHQATVAKHLIDGREIVFREKGERMQKPEGKRNYVPLDSRRRCGSLSHLLEPRAR